MASLCVDLIVCAPRLRFKYAYPPSICSVVALLWTDDLFLECSYFRTCPRVLSGIMVSARHSVVLCWSRSRPSQPFFKSLHHRFPELLGGAVGGEAKKIFIFLAGLGCFCTSQPFLVAVYRVKYRLL